MASRKKSFPQIPAIPQDLLLPISSLVRTCSLFQGVLIQMAEGKPWEEIAHERGEYLELGEKILTAWMRKLGIDNDEGDEMHGS